MNVLVTVGIPFFNAETFLEDAIRSVVNQSTNCWTLILIDDGSTDSSLQIAKKYERPNIIVVSDGQKKGLSFRLNQITSLCNTKYIARMDADDIMHPSRMEKQLKFLENNQNVDVVGSRIISIDNKNTVYGKRGSTIIPDNSLQMLQSGVFNHATITGKHKWFDDNKYSSKYGILVNGVYNRLEDYELWFRTIDHSTFFVLPDYLLFYREIDIPFLNKYLKTNISMRQFLRENRRRIGLLRTYSLILKSYLKDTIYRIYAVIDNENALIKKRSEKLTSYEVESYNDLLKQAIR